MQETSGATVLANILTGLGIDEFLTRTDVVAGTTSSFLSDALRSPVALADSTGAVQTEYTYEPFGKTTATGVSNTNPFQYTGRENDGTGLYYYRARYYQPGLQRFISEDPHVRLTPWSCSSSEPDAFKAPVKILVSDDPRDFNLLYGYVRNNPLLYTDPTGLQIGDCPQCPPSPPRCVKTADEVYRLGLAERVRRCRYVCFPKKGEPIVYDFELPCDRFPA